MWPTHAHTWSEWWWRQSLRPTPLWNPPQQRVSITCRVLADNTGSVGIHLKAPGKRNTSVCGNLRSWTVSHLHCTLLLLVHRSEAGQNQLSLGSGDRRHNESWYRTKPSCDTPRDYRNYWHHGNGIMNNSRQTDCEDSLFGAPHCQAGSSSKLFVVLKT